MVVFNFYEDFSAFITADFRAADEIKIYQYNYITNRKFCQPHSKNKICEKFVKCYCILDNNML